MLPGSQALSALSVFSVVLAGCASQGIYSSPRTIAAGRLQHDVYVEFQGISRTAGSGVYPIPALGYAARYGLARHFEGGARVTVLGVFGIDLKLQLVRSAGFDLAINPSAVTALTVGYLHLPAIAGINLSPNLQVLLGARYSYGFALLRGIGGSLATAACASPTATRTDIEIRDLAMCDSAVGAMAGFRYVTGSSRRGIALQPEYNISRTVSGSEDVTLHTFSLSVSFGALPQFTPEDEAWESRESGLAPEPLGAPSERLTPPLQSPNTNYPTPPALPTPPGFPPPPPP